MFFISAVSFSAIEAGRARAPLWFLVFIVHVDLAELAVGIFKQISDGSAALNGRLVRYFNPQVKLSVPL